MLPPRSYATRARLVKWAYSIRVVDMTGLRLEDRVVEPRDGDRVRVRALPMVQGQHNSAVLRFRRLHQLICGDYAGRLLSAARRGSRHQWAIKWLSRGENGLQYPRWKALVASFPTVQRGGSERTTSRQGGAKRRKKRGKKKGPGCARTHPGRVSVKGGTAQESHPVVALAVINLTN